jgi:murein DD-endopeptidase MepM/ murein hydrolase activator NlpD
MFDPRDSIDAGAACASCGDVLRDRLYIQAEARAGHIYCSEICLEAGMRELGRWRWTARRRHARRLTIAVALVGGCLTPHQGAVHSRPARVARPAPLQPSEPPPLPAGWFGPEWPPTDDGILAALGRDAWIHPLAGPVRRMPQRDSRVFGAARPGNRAVECRNGHCGVDLGGEIWGEHVHVVHDGVVEWVQRGANPQHGGQYVRVVHRGGSVVTQYFHLAAIPREIERGTALRAGDVVGLLGDTGVKDSAPHLHFSISIRTTPDRPEKYFDPEPLMALWPLRVPINGTEAGLVTTIAAPGVPLGSMPLSSARRRRLAAHGKRAVAAEVADGDESAGAASGGESEASVPETSTDD